MLIYPLCDSCIMWPALHHSDFIFISLKTSGGIAVLPVLTYNAIVVFIGFSLLTNWKVLSLITPKTNEGCGTFPIPHLSMFHIWLGEKRQGKMSGNL